MKTERILLLHWGQTGAGPKLLLELARAMSDLAGRDRIAISYNEDNQHSDEMKALRLISLPVRTYDRTAKSTILNLPRVLILRKRLRSFAKSHSVGTVYSVMENPYQSIATSNILRNPFRLVSTIHDAVPHDGDRATLTKIITREVLRSSDHIVTLSDHVTTLLSENHDIADASISTLFHPAWEGEMREPRPAIPNTRTIRIGFFGRLLPYKGVRLMLESVRQLRRDGFNVEAILYGHGPESALAPLYTDVAPNWNPGWVDDDDIPSILDAMDILVLPYLEASQSGVLAYALTTGLPVVATPTGGLQEQVMQTNSGLVTEDFTSESIAMAVRRLIEDPDLYRQASTNAINAAHGSYSWRNFAESLEPILFRTRPK